MPFQWIFYWLWVVLVVVVVVVAAAASAVVAVVITAVSYSPVDKVQTIRNDINICFYLCINICNTCNTPVYGIC